ncbi:HNH endonuclease family protein [Actinokineospora soli]|uniref:HNH endonuclease family protein n=1 Tax=Actinokineospora soli TaxID=1048753 RepID=A0ABW2TZJ3_9PSEU
MTKTRAILGSLLLSAALTVGLAGAASATPPNIPSASTAWAELGALRVASEGSMTGYSRDKFPHWITISGTCNTRETVLKRDGSNVVTDSSCYATSGSWYSPYDGATWYSPADVDIDHIVPLAEAWRSGASSWTTSTRQAFANDLNNPQLIAVTDHVNQSKGDQDPSTWKPSRTSYWCTYAKMWVRTKYRYNLAVQSSEKSALSSMLNYC